MLFLGFSHCPREKVESALGSHLEGPLEVSTKKGTLREEASREFGRKASHIWPCETACAVPVLCSFLTFSFLNVHLRQRNG